MTSLVHLQQNPLPHETMRDVTDDGSPALDGHEARWRYTVRTLLRSKTFIAASIVVVLWVFMAAAWPIVVRLDPQEMDVMQILSGPSRAHWLGTDSLGRDVAARMFAGSTSVLMISVVATALSIMAGTMIGLVAGFKGGLFDEVIMRVMDILLAFPTIILAVLVLSLLGSSAGNVILVITIVFTPLVARTVRSAVLAEREKAYVEAARMRGESLTYILSVEILPNITAPIVVETTSRLAYAVFTAATLAFLRLGVRQPSPDWGLTISIERVNLAVYAGSTLFPALALASLVVSVTLLADTVRKVLDE